MGWDIRMTMRYTHATSLVAACAEYGTADILQVWDDLRRQFGCCRLDRHKTPAVDGNGPLPVSARFDSSGRVEDSNLRPHHLETCNPAARLLRCDHIY